MKNIKFIYFDGMGVLLEVNKPLSYYFSQVLGFPSEKFHEYELQSIKNLPTAMSEKFWHLSTLAEEIEYCREFNQLFLQNAGIKNSDQLTEQLTALRVKPDVRLKLGVKEGLEKLSHHFRLGVLTNAMPSRKYYELTIDGIDRYFDQIIISREIGHHKPEPEAYQLAIEKSRVAPEEILFVDDQEKYLEGAIRAGIGRVILMNNASTGKFPSVKDFSELRDLLTKTD